MSAAITVLKPKRLAPGQTIGLIAPSSPASEDDQIHAALELLESLGFRVKTGAHLYRRYGYLAGSDAERAADLNDMFADPTVDAIVAFRGGYGASRLLPYLDYDLIRRNPKVLMGYSDITARLNGIHAKTGLVTFHGPIADGNFTLYTLAEFKKVLLNPEPPMVIGAPPASATGEGVVERKNRLVRIAPGTARGQLIGGNLTLMAHLTGTPYQPDFRGKILFLEDVHEAIYALDRYLTQLWLAGLLQQVTGIVLGKFTDCKPTYSSSGSLTLEQALADRCLPLGIPVLHGLMIGHIDEQTIVPVGCEAELDVERLGWRKLAGANLMVNLTTGGSPEEFLVDYFRQPGQVTVGLAGPDVRVPMIPLILSPHDSPVLDANVGLYSCRYQTQNSCMGLYPRYTRALDNGAGAFFAARTTDGRVVGLATARHIDDDPGEYVYQIDGFVHHRFAPAWPDLIQAACEWARTQGATTLCAQIGAEDGAKQAVFQALGFVYVGVGEGFQGNHLATWRAVVKT